MCNRYAAVPVALRAVPDALRAFQMVAEDNGTQIISAANKQYKGRKSLAAFQDPLGPPYEGEEGFQEREIILVIVYNFVL